MKPLWILPCVVLAACQTDDAPSDGDVTVEPQQCRIAAEACASFMEKLPSFRDAVSKPVNSRNSIEDLAVNLVLKTMLDLQVEADKNCSPTTGQLREIARLQSKAGATGVVFGDGGDMCTLSASRN